ncbi:UDP-4-amino-4,6-dideoxy-N-acetyl-beta-L-altrosami ne transaminase [Chitinimonas prasina]|uniref:UDP-4-amino-4, 6-dideoxy-N-acetyl-beta-L-altrosami ne transaminase n=1 Tax=Chitinimonas prasina TaxID=1434937 RepID=A0ABQ5YEM3_9NEIS|nr:UDP-4-amino-4,6-dideoxy-N-acetyl-beta-L-altrosamine transaminase [Chitinimonas prasina]GLR12928.1 UDP-4-amino-4,6-dideoxy-N-acetyl-beta-L-altrosami ne transaminase [Chitinimonas prasina]
MIPYGRQQIDQADIDAVVATLQSDWLTQGPAIARFERAIAEHCEARHAVAVCNATAALHIACLALDLGPGELLWTTPNTFVASANCGRYCGADVDFVDIDPRTWNMCPQQLARKLEAAALAGRLPKIVVPVAFSGQSCDMARIRELSRQYGFYVVEDASHAVGASYRGRPVGCGDYADMTIFSFHPVKIITTGEGGLILTNRDDLAERLARLRSHGITRDAALMQGESDGPWYYQQLELGYNYRMTDIQAALGYSQWQRLEPFLARRRALAARYDLLLADLPLQLPHRQADADSAWHLYVVRVQGGLDHRKVFDALRMAGIGVNLHYIPVHTQPYYQSLGFKQGDYPEAERYYAEAISLPMYAALQDSEQDQVVAALRQAVAA